DQLHRLATVAGLGHHLDAAIERQQGLDALAYQGLVIDQADSDHGNAPSMAGSAGADTGTDRRSTKPAPFRVWMSSVPPHCCSRSCMPRRPLPGTTPSAPSPSSR